MKEGSNKKRVPGYETEKEITKRGYQGMKEGSNKKRVPGYERRK